MNKKTKNIVSVLQSMSAAVLCTLCSVLFLASCNDESLVDNPHAQNALRTVSVDLGMPQGKPAYGDGTDSRAADAEKPAEILLGDSTLAVSRTSSDTYYTTTSWANKDELLVKIEAGSTEARLTLKYTAPAQGATSGTWTLIKNNSYVKYTGTAFALYSEVEPVFFTEDEYPNNDMSITGALTMRMDWTAGQPTVSIIYAPDMQWSLAQDNTVSMEQKNSATAATTAPELWTTNDNGWTTPQARLRVNTGRGNAGDVVTLTSKAFVSALETKPQDNVYTATTDDQGDAYFYGTTNGVLKGNSEDNKFEIKLIQMRVPVPQPAPRASEGRSVALDDAKQNVIITLDTPITLLEASDVVPVTLAAETAYKLMAEDKRNTAKTENMNSLNVIDGSCTNLDLITKQIEAAIAMDITDFTVINQLASYSNQDSAGSVVGEAIRQFGESNSGTKISLTLADATEVIDGAFYECTALQSVSAPAATSIGECAFDYCTSLLSVSLPEATTIGSYAFSDCTALMSVSLPEATTIGLSAFQSCTGLTSVSLPEATTIGSYAFSDCTVLTTVTLPKVEKISISAFLNCTSLASVVANSATEIWPSVFSGCTALTSVTFGAVIETIEHDSPGDSPFSDFSTENCDLTLHAAQLNHATYPVSASNGKLMWAEKAWKSITLLDGPNGTAGTKYYIDNDMPTVEVDGTCGITGNNPIGEATHVSAMKQKIKVVADAATADAPAKIFVKNGLARYQKGNEINTTVVGQAIHDLASDRNSPNYGTISITIADATELPSGAFFECYALNSVTFNQSVAIGDAAFSNCTALESVEFIGSGNTIGNAAFMLCALTGIDWTKVTSIDAAAFSVCPLTGTVDLSQVTTVVANAFEDTSVSNCDLVLPAGQESNVTVSNDGKLMWAGAAWKSITMGDRVYTQMNGFVQLEKDNVSYAVIDGSLTDSQAVKNKVNTALNAGIYNLYVANGLAKASNRTYVGDAIYQLASAVTPASTEMVNYNGQISLLLDNQITAIPNSAFSGCNALQSVTAPGAYQIGDAAFENCTNLQTVEIGENADDNIKIGKNAFKNAFNNDENLRVIKFYKVVESVDYGAFDGVNYQICNLFFNENQWYSDLNPNGYEWCGERWCSITSWPLNPYF